MDSGLCIFSFPNQFQNIGCSSEVIFITHRTQCGYRKKIFLPILTTVFGIFAESEQWKTFNGCVPFEFGTWFSL